MCSHTHSFTHTHAQHSYMFTHVHAYTPRFTGAYPTHLLTSYMFMSRHDHMPMHTCSRMFVHMVPFAQPRLFVSPGSLITCISSTRMTTEPQPATCGSDMGSPWSCLLPTLLLLLFLNSENPPQETPEKLPLHCHSHPQGGTKGPSAPQNPSPPCREPSFWAVRSDTHPRKWATPSRAVSLNPFLTAL